MSDAPIVLFICQHNAGRSQLGAHLLQHVAGERFQARSAGIAPAESINPTIAASLNELGIDTSAALPRRVTIEDLETADVVITMKPGIALPGPVAGQHVEWEFPDPTDWGDTGVQSLRDVVLNAVRTFAETQAETSATRSS